MRWKSNRQKARVGLERVKEKFLFLPCKIGKDVRWLENAKIRQRFMDSYHSGGPELAAFPSDTAYTRRYHMW